MNIKKIEFAFNGKNALSLKIIVREEDVFMLKTWIPEEIPEKEELKKRIKEAGEKLYQQQMKLKEHKLPVLVLFEGWGASGKGTTIGRVIKYIDPRFFKVATMSKPTEDELRRPFCTGISIRFRKPANLPFWILAGWSRPAKTV